MKKHSPPANNDWRLQIARLDLKPGDTLVASIPAERALWYHARLREDLELIAPKGVAILFIDDAVKLSIIPGESTK